MTLRRGLLLLAVATVCACRRSSAPASPRPAPPAARVTIVTDRLALETLDKLPLDEARRRLPDVFRLRPDRRFMIALAELEILAAARTPARLRVSWSGEAWRIDSSGERVGEVPPVATYGDFRRVLAARARTLLPVAGGHPAAAGAPDLSSIRKDCEAFDAASQIRVLKAVDERWPASGLPEAELVGLAAQAAVALSAQSLDTLEIADLLRARALALLALAEALGQPAAPARESLLAASLGYWPDAVRIARDLPADDAARLYAEVDTPGLVEAAGREGADARTRYLALLSLAERRDRIAWSKFQEARFGHEGFSLPVLRAATALDSFEMNASIGNATIYAALDDLGGPPGADAPRAAASHDATQPTFGDLVVAKFSELVRRQQKLQTAGLVKQFEARLAAASAAARGPVWDAHAFRAWHRGFFYSGLHTLGHRYLDELAAPQASREFVAYLEGSPPGAGEQFARWYADLSAVLSGRQVSDQHFDDLAALTALGSPAVRRLALELRTSFYKGQYASAVLAERVAGRLDARPANVGFMRVIARHPLFDMRLVEGTCRAWLAMGWRDELGTTGHCLRFLGDTPGLLALLGRRDVPIEVRVEALSNYAASETAVESICRSQFRALAEECGFDRVVVRPWLEYSEKRKDDAEGQRAAEGWLAHHDESSGLWWYVYRGRLAHYLSLRGRDAEAWGIIEPGLRTGQGAVMRWGAEILEKLGRPEEAHALARQAVDRYPDAADTRAVLASMLWRAKRYSEAALVLDPPEAGYKVNDDAFRTDVAPRFAEIFAKAPDETVESAFAALRGQGVRTQRLASLLPPLAAAGRNELAFRLQTQLASPHQHPWEIADWRREGFGYLEKAQGRTAAVTWIQAALPAAQLDNTLSSMFNKKAWPFLWDVVSPADEPKVSEWGWVFRAGAAAVDPATSAARRPMLLEHYREPRPGQTTWTIGRYLLGLENRDAVLASVTAEVDRCAAAYFLGLKDISSGRYEDASDWFQLVNAICSKPPSWGFVAFAHTTTSEWSRFDRDLRTAAARKVW